MKIVLLNPPAPVRVIRDYYCTSLAKSTYYYHPIDLVYMSGTLAAAHDICVIDAIADGLSVHQALLAIQRQRPDAIVALVASPTLSNDLRFLQAVKRSCPSCRIVVTGDVVRELGGRLLAEQPWIDAAITDFSTDVVVAAVEGTTTQVLPNLVMRRGDSILAGEELHTNGTFSVRRPAWKLFLSDRYRFPFAHRAPFACVLTDFGCPYDCTFCPVSTLGFKLRPVSEVVEELVDLKQLGVKELHFRDQTFGVNKRRAFELCEAMRELDFTWSCFTRVDVITEPLLREAKQAGCHTVIFGIETADDQLLSDYKKGTTHAQVRAALELCRRHCVSSVGTFLLGLPGETTESAERTIAYACSLPLDFASFNVAVPRLGSTFRKQAVAAGLVRADVLELRPEALSEAYVGSAVNHAQGLVRLANQRFYRRIPYLIQRVRRSDSFWSFANQVRIGWQLVG